MNEVMSKLINKPSILIANRADLSEENVFYCGRGSVLGNPFPINKENSRDFVCDRYEDWFKENKGEVKVVKYLKIIANTLKKRKTVTLSCFCAPKRCHCETIKKYLEEDLEVNSTVEESRKGPTINTPCDIATPSSNPSLTYAGIGARKTPTNILQLMSRIAVRLETYNYKLLSGGAKGADQAFASYVDDKQIFVPWLGYNGLKSASDGVVLGTEKEAKYIDKEIAPKFHKNWNRLSITVRLLMIRSVHQILGKDLKTPVDFVVCWTSDGAETTTSISTGGTGFAIRIANHYKIPVINLKNKDALYKIKDLINTY